MRDFKYKTIFASKVRCLADEEKDKILAQASLDSLKSVISEKYRGQIDLLPIAFNSCTPNLANKNGDMIDSQTALDIYKKFISRPINVEHLRGNGAIGHIVSSAFSKFNINYSLGSGSELIEAKDIKDKKEPFNLSLAGVLYKLYSPDFIDLVEESNDPSSKRYMMVSASWELLFDSFSLAIGSKYLQDCEIIDDKDKVEELAKHLTSYGGSGKIDGKPVFRLVKGEVYPVGIGLTSNPAAEVSGLYVDKEQSSKASQVIDNQEDTKSKEIVKRLSDIDAEFKVSAKDLGEALKRVGINSIESILTIDDLIEKLQKNDKTDKNQEILSVITTNNKDIDKKIPMKIEKIKDITDENLKECKASELQGSLQSILDNEIKKISDDYTSKLTQKEKDIKAAQDSVDQLKTQHSEIEKKFNDTKKQLDDIIEQNKVKEKAELYSARMNTLEEKFELNDKQKGVVGKRVKSIETEEQFTEYLTEAEILFKKKEEKEEKKEKVEAKASTETVDTQTVVDKTIKDSKVTTAAIPNAQDKTETLVEKAKKAFGSDGWEVNKLRKS